MNLSVTPYGRLDTPPAKASKNAVLTPRNEDRGEPLDLSQDKYRVRIIRRFADDRMYEVKADHAAAAMWRASVWAVHFGMEDVEGLWVMGKVEETLQFSNSQIRDIRERLNDPVDEIVDREPPVLDAEIVKRMMN